MTKTTRWALLVAALLVHSASSAAQQQPPRPGQVREESIATDNASAAAPELRVVPAGRPRNLVDAGDYYWADGGRIYLLRVANEVLVGLAPETDSEGLVRELTSPGGPLAGFEKTAALGDTILSFAAPVADDVEASLAAVATAAGVSWAAPVFFNPEGGGRLWVTEEVVVALEADVDPETFFDTDFAAYRRLLGTPDQYVATLAGGGSWALEEANRLQHSPGVAWAAPNFRQEFRRWTNDPRYGDQWHLNNTGQTGAQVGADVDAPEAWVTTTGSGAIVIAVLDDGVQTTHPDLAANIFVNIDEVPDNGVDDDGNGWVDDVNGWDFHDGDNNPNPTAVDDMHGTAVAGVAAAVGGNALGVTGICQSCKIMPLKISQGDSFASDADIAQAVYYGAGRTADGLGTWRAADVLNNSWGGGSPATVLSDAFNWASASGRGGLGAASFVATGNSASGYLSFTLTGFSLADWIIEWRYTKDGGVSSGDDTVWLANVRLPDGSIERFDSPSAPSGWLTGGSAPWAIVADPAPETGHYAVKAGAIADGQTTIIRSPTATGSESLTFSAWVSSEEGYDWFETYVSQNGGASFLGPYLAKSGVPETESAVAYPASLNSTIAVGASTDWDYRSHYSQYGSALDFVAPSKGGNAGITTTDRTGTDGYNDESSPAGDYSAEFGGTSSATPLAAGIGALLLSKNPALTAAEVRSAMRNTAEKIGGAAYVDGSNGYYGYGRLNAAAALAAVASAVSPTPTNTTTPTGTLEPTHTPTGAPTPTVEPEPRTTISIGEARAAPGQAAEFDVVLDTDVAVAGAENSITFQPGTPISGCTVNPGIHKEASSFAFRPAGCTPGKNCTRLTALILSFSNIDPIPDGSVLYTCTMVIPDSVPLGSYPLECSRPGANSPDGAPVPAVCRDGEVVVHSPPPTFTPTPTPTMTPTITPTSTPTPVPCLGDGDGDRVVTIAELIRAVRNSLDGCPAVP